MPLWVGGAALLLPDRPEPGPVLAAMEQPFPWAIAESAIDLLGSSDTVFVRSPSDWSPIVGNLARNSLANGSIVATGQRGS